MTQTNFDDFATNYDEELAKNIGKYGDVAYYAQHKCTTSAKYLKKHPTQVMDFGCGVGRNIPFLKKQFPQAEVAGCDISEDSIQEAAKNNPDSTFFVLENEIPKEHQNCYDYILASCVFHHIPVDERAHSMHIIKSMLRPGGQLFIFEHNPYNPLTQRAVNTCPFDKDAVLLPPRETNQLTDDAGLDRLRTHYTLFFSSALKRLQPFEKFLFYIPLGGQYFMQAQKKYAEPNAK